MYFDFDFGLASSCVESLSCRFRCCQVLSLTSLQVFRVVRVCADLQHKAQGSTLGVDVYCTTGHAIASMQLPTCCCRNICGYCRVCFVAVLRWEFIVEVWEFEPELSGWLVEVTLGGALAIAIVPPKI